MKARKNFFTALKTVNITLKVNSVNFRTCYVKRLLFKY